MSHQEQGATQPIIIHEDIQQDRILLECQVPHDLIYLKGHFTDMPVVAGVCQIKWVMDAITRYFGRTPVLAGMEAVKFHQLLFPGDEFLIDVKRTAQPPKWVYRITSGKKKVAAGRLLDAEEHTCGGDAE